MQTGCSTRANLSSSAQVFDTVWQQFQKLSSPTKSTALTMEDFDMAGRSEFSSPQVCCGQAAQAARKHINCIAALRSVSGKNVASTDSMHVCCQLYADWRGWHDTAQIVQEDIRTGPHLQASFTTVLVCGATGRVGRVLVRKLLLRGYKVRTS